MKTEVLRQLDSTLPPDDDHPYRSGPWRPQTTERRAWDLDVEGEIPTDLAGVYLRNTENPLHPPISLYHPFDGDGMIHSISFADGDAVYHNRFVPTDGLVAEQAEGRSLWAGVAESKSLAERPGWGARGGMKDASSTDVVVHHGKALTSFWQCGDLYRLDPVTLAPDGKETWGGRFPAEGVSAHTKVDENTGELLFFNYSTEFPYMHYGVLDPHGNLAHYTPIELPGPRLPHDMAFTENYAILNDCPMFYNPKGLAAGHYYLTFYPEMTTRFAIVPRRGTSGTVLRSGTNSDVIWFDAEPTFVLHWINAYEEGDEVVLDGFFQHNPAPTPLPHLSPQENAFRYLDLHTMQSEARRWRFNLVTGETEEEPLSDRIMEFGMINGTYGGRPYRYSYNALPVRGWFGFEGLVKHDLQTGCETVVTLADGEYCSETVMAPRLDSKAEDDGYLITFTVDMNNDESRCKVFDAADPGAGPVASILLPERLSSGTHACWAPAATL